MVSDPLSGLFAFRRASVNLDRLKPAGFKVLLEILVRNPVARVAEVAYRFEPRAAGDSKASLRQGVTFLRHLARLRAARLARQLRERPATRSERISQAVRFIAFGLVGATGHRGQQRGTVVLLPHAGLEPPARRGAGHPGLHDMELPAGR